jgi:hypothetical protein
MMGVKMMGVKMMGVKMMGERSVPNCRSLRAAAIESLT